MYLSSDNIKVFPATRRSGQYDPFSRLMSESTITSIINRLVDCDGFVINDVSDRFSYNYDTNPPLEFNVFGYYIKIDDVKGLLNNFSGDDIYAVIALDTNAIPSGTGPSYTQIIGVDDDSLYKGVDFVNAEPELSATQHALHILTVHSGTGNNRVWEIPKASVIKFYNIDGGEIFSGSL